MTIDEAIKHAEEVADYDCYNKKQFKCAKKHRQLAEWLKDYKRLLEQEKWIPVSERVPKRSGYYLVTGRQGAVNKRLYQDGHWYGNWAILAWMPLPEPYKESES